MDSIDDKRAAAMLSALGSEARLGILRVLVRAGRAGISVTGIRQKTGQPPSTLNHHLAAMVAAGVVSQERSGRELICRAEYDEIRLLSALLLRECCADAPPAPAKP